MGIVGVEIGGVIVGDMGISGMGISGMGIGSVTPNSKAPISRIPTARAPRWSVVVGVAPPSLLLALMAGLPTTRAKVLVKPPLSARVVLITVLAAPVGTIIGVAVVKPPSMPFTPFVPTMFISIKLRFPTKL